MAPPTSADAALKWLQYKGTIHDANGRPTRYLGHCDALRRYNAAGGVVNGVPAADDYANSIMNNRGLAMGLGSSKSIAALCLAVLTAGLWLAPAVARELNSGIWKVMRDGGATRSFDDEEDRIWPIGDINIGSRHYRFMHYEYLQSKRHMVPGGVQHGHTRLLVFEVLKKRLIYLGGYTYFAGDFSPYGARPHIEGNAVVFPYKEEIQRDNLNDRIVLDEKGPPSRVVLDGEICDFFK